MSRYRPTKPQNDSKKPKIALKSPLNIGFRPNTSLHIKGIYASKPKNKVHKVSKDRDLAGMGSLDRSKMSRLSTTVMGNSALANMKSVDMRNHHNSKYHSSMHSSIDRVMPENSELKILSPLSIRVQQKPKLDR